MPTIIVYWSPTRSPQEKQAVANGFIETLVDKGKANRDDILIVFQNIEDGDAFRGKSNSSEAGSSELVNK